MLRSSRVVFVAISRLVPPPGSHHDGTCARRTEGHHIATVVSCCRTFVSSCDNPSPSATRPEPPSCRIVLSDVLPSNPEAACRLPPPLSRHWMLSPAPFEKQKQGVGRSSQNLARRNPRPSRTCPMPTNVIPSRTHCSQACSAARRRPFLD